MDSLQDMSNELMGRLEAAEAAARAAEVERDAQVRSGNGCVGEDCV